MIIQVVSFKSRLSECDVRRTIHERADSYRNFAGLLQKYYIQRAGTGEYGGIYFWEDEPSLHDFRTSKFAGTIPDAYGVDGQSAVDTFEVMCVLR